MPKYSVTIEAFGYVSVRNIAAATRAEAEAEALKRIGFKVESAKQDDKVVVLHNHSVKV